MGCLPPLCVCEDVSQALPVRLGERRGTAQRVWVTYGTFYFGFNFHNNLMTPTVMAANLSTFNSWFVKALFGNSQAKTKKITGQLRSLKAKFYRVNS